MKEYNTGGEEYLVVYANGLGIVPTSPPRSLLWPLQKSTLTA